MSEIDSVKTQLIACQGLLEEKENELLKIKESSQKLLEDREEYRLMASKYKCENLKLHQFNEELREKLSNSKQDSKTLNFEEMAIEAQFSSLQDEVAIYKDKCKQSTLFQEEMRALIRSNSELQDKLSSKNKECSALEQEIQEILKRIGACEKKSTSDNSMNEINYKSMLGEEKQQQKVLEIKLQDTISLLSLEQTNVSDLQNALQEVRTLHEQNAISQTAEIQALKSQILKYEAQLDFKNSEKGSEECSNGTAMKNNSTKTNKKGKKLTRVQLRKLDPNEVMLDSVPNKRTLRKRI